MALSAQLTDALLLKKEYKLYTKEICPFIKEEKYCNSATYLGQISENVAKNSGTQFKFLR